jgi:hypothetical protein
MKRREFLWGAVAVPAVVAASEWYAAAKVLSSNPWQVTAVIYDARYVDCERFAKALEREGVMLFESLGDVASIWYGALRTARARSGGSVAGMGADSDWVVSRECGREQGLRVAYEGSHDCRTSDRLIHRLRGGRQREVYAALLEADTPWAESVAKGLVRSSVSEQGPLRSAVAILKAEAMGRSLSAGHPGYLTSWLLSPTAI